MEPCRGNHGEGEGVHGGRGEVDRSRPGSDGAQMILCANPLAQFQSHQAEIEEAIQRVLGAGRYILGPEVNALEEEFSAYIGARYGIGVANGTDSLELAM